MVIFIKTLRIENQVEFLKKLVNSLLRRASKNSLLGLSKPLAMWVVMIFVTFISTTVFTDAKDSKIIKSPNEYFCDRNVEIITTVSENKIQLARQWNVLLYQGFDEYGEDQKHQKDTGITHIFRWEYAFPNDWKFTNFKNALKTSISQENDTHNAYLIISGSDKGRDTAFELSSPIIPVKDGKPYTVTFRCQLSKKLIAQRGFGGKYETGIIWLASDNKKITETPFSLLNEEDVYKDWYTRKIEVISPERASMAIIRFGFDLPNLALKQARF